MHRLSTKTGGIARPEKPATQSRKFDLENAEDFEQWTDAAAKSAH
jgi:hypothetical protein